MGKTMKYLRKKLVNGKHPHVHGEDSPLTAKKPRTIETPPRAWGRLFGTEIWLSCPRNTPTCMGKTTPMLRFGNIVTETPPRAWGRLSACPVIFPMMGNTPTCMGKTSPRRSAVPFWWKHPHVHGEDLGHRPNLNQL